MVTVFKLTGEAYEITEDPTVYSSREKALEEAKQWEPFLGMTVEEALKTKEIQIKEYTLI